MADVDPSSNAPRQRKPDFEPLQPEPSWLMAAASATWDGCVEVAQLADSDVGIRDSRNPEASHHRVGRIAWKAFIQDAKKVALIYHSY